MALSPEMNRDWGVSIFGLSGRNGTAIACRANAESMNSMVPSIEVFPLSRLVNPSERPERRPRLNYYHFNPVDYAISKANSHALLQSPWWRDRQNVAYWAWETTRVPAIFLEWSRKLDEVWVPTEFVARILQNSKCECPVHVVPHSVMPAGSVSSRKREDYKPDFTVLFMWDARSLSVRKNPEAVVRVFRQAFPQSEAPNALLILKCHQINREDLIALRQAAGDDTDRIKLLNGFVRREDLEDLYRQADCFLSLHRSEGFGLHLAESFARGIPVIATGFGGNTDWMTSISIGAPDRSKELRADNGNSLLVNYRMCPVDHFLFEGGEWADPDEKDAVRKLRWLWEHYGDDRVAEMIRNGQAMSADRFSAEQLQEKIRGRLEEYWK